MNLGTRCTAASGVAFAFVAALPMSSPGQSLRDGDEVSAPALKVGQAWTYRTVADPRDQQLRRPRFEWTRKVEAVEGGYAFVVTGSDGDDNAVSRYTSTKAMAFEQQVGDDRNTYEPLGFPMRAGKKWDTRNLRAGSQGILDTKYECRARSTEIVKVPAGEFQTIPIECKGQWRNLRSGFSDQAVEVRWYAPAVGATVKSSVETWLRGSPYAKWTDELISFQIGN